MNPVKAILPTLLIAACAALVYYYFSYLPAPVQQALPLLPYIFSAAVMLMAFYFNLGGLFYFSLACFLSWFLLNQSLLLDAFTLNIVFIGILLAVLLIGILAEKGLLTIAAWLSHSVVIMIAAISYGLLKRQPPWLSAWIQPEILPQTWLAWTPLGLTAWFLLLLSLLVVMLLFILLKKRQAFNALVTMVVVVLLFHYRENALALGLTCAAGCLALLLSALQNAWHLAYVDELTALPGRRALQEKLQRSLGIYALAMVDIDHFKKFNDSYGHDVGDDVLRMIAAQIGQVSGGGKAYRYGGEEFTVVFNNHSADEVKIHLQALIKSVAETPFVVNRRKNQKPKTVQVTISIGLTDSIHKANASQTIKVADEALYLAKKKGRNRLSVKT